LNFLLHIGTKYGKFYTKLQFSGKGVFPPQNGTQKRPR